MRRRRQDLELDELAMRELARVDDRDPEILAIEHGLRVLDASRSPSRRCRQGLLVGRAILVDESLPKERRAFSIAHELAHYLLRRDGIPDTEPAANYLAGALLLPRPHFAEDLEVVGWDLVELRSRYPLASAATIARRICELQRARACVWDLPVGSGHASVHVIPESTLAPTEEELEAATEAHRTGVAVELRDGLTAWPLLAQDWHRVITLARLGRPAVAAIRVR